eukprot:comp21839_c0_seq1/m.31177 comp21839_c0_seq1/g.31177  ORF comp21839_c0_seq1/g.31177 comp21839_c0_seq1/m.31177 type:complete len:148 (-) comp21839_c0_seq1:672-1115(-)
MSNNNRRNESHVGAAVGIGVALGAVLTLGISALVDYFNTPQELQTYSTGPPQARPVDKETKLVSDYEDEVPIASFYCPITHELMVDPVQTPYGHCYERSAIVRHVEMRGTDPLTNQGLRVEDLRPSINLRNAIQEYIETQRRVESKM